MARGGAGASFFLAVLMAGILNAHAAVPEESLTADEECLSCHNDLDLKKEVEGGRSLSLFVDPAHLAQSPHKELACVKCHVGISEGPHDDEVSKVRCEVCHKRVPAAMRKSVHAAWRGRAAEAPTCAACHGSHEMRAAAVFDDKECRGCHRKAVDQYRGSAHGSRQSRKEEGAPTCLSCHGGGHSVLSSTDATSPTYHLNLPRTCAKCHADPALVKQAKIRTADVYKLYLDSIHGRALSRSGLLVAANCSDCHGSHDVRRHTDPAARVYRENIPETCGQCHAGVLTTYWESAHGQAVRAGNVKAPVCSDCHTAHQIRRVEMDPWKLQIVQECGTCHESSLLTYRDTFHGQVTALGFTRVARCSDCHGSHAIFPPSDLRSTLSPGRIVATCQQCHPRATTSFGQYYPHANYKDKGKLPILYYTYRSMTLLLWGVLGFFGLHTILWFPRSLQERLARRRQPGNPPPGGPGVPGAGHEDPGGEART